VAVSFAIICAVTFARSEQLASALSLSLSTDRGFLTSLMCLFNALCLIVDLGRPPLSRDAALEMLDHGHANSWRGHPGLLRATTDENNGHGILGWFSGCWSVTLPPLQPGLAPLVLTLQTRRAINCCLTAGLLLHLRYPWTLSEEAADALHRAAVVYVALAEEALSTYAVAALVAPAQLRWPWQLAMGSILWTLVIPFCGVSPELASILCGARATILPLLSSRGLLGTAGRPAWALFNNEHVWLPLHAVAAAVAVYVAMLRRRTTAVSAAARRAR